MAKIYLTHEDLTLIPNPVSGQSVIGIPSSGLYQGLVCTKNSSGTIKPICDGSINERSGHAVITSDPFTVVFSSPLSSVAYRFSGIPMCYNSANNLVIAPKITNKTINGFDISIGDTSGTIDYEVKL